MYWNKKKKKKSKDWKAELNVEMENEESKREKNNNNWKKTKDPPSMTCISWQNVYQSSLPKVASLSWSSCGVSDTRLGSSCSCGCI